MQKAKAAAEGIISKAGSHDTTVQERTAPAVQEETIRPHRHEEVQEVVDREVHKDHHHTTVQPIHDREVRAEEHHHRTGPVVEKEFSHGNDDHIRRQNEDINSQFRNTSTTHDTKHSTSNLASVEGERVHHHVHETVQPVVQKETITPEVVHTTVPIHETHHGGSKHHGTSVLPTQSLKEFTSGGGNIAGRDETNNYYEGHPKPYDEMLHHNKHTEGEGHHHGSHHHDTTGTNTGATTGGLTGSHHHHDTTGTNTGATTGGLTGSHTGGNTGTTTGTTGSSTTNKLESKLESHGDNIGDGRRNHPEYQQGGNDLSSDGLHRGGNTGGTDGTTPLSSTGNQYGSSTGNQYGSGVDSSTHGSGVGSSTHGAGVSEPDRGTDPSAVGQGDQTHNQEHDGQRKTIGASAKKT